MPIGRLTSINYFALRLLLCLAFLFAALINLNAQQTKEDCLAIIDSASHIREGHKYAEAIKIFSEVEVLAKKNNWHNMLWYIYNQYGMCYEALSNIGEALGYYHKALSVIGNNEKTEAAIIGESSVLNNIGLLYMKNGESSKGITYMKEAEDLLVKTGVSPSLRKTIGINVADSYIRQGMYGEAFQKLKDVEHIQADLLVRTLWETTYAELLYHMGKVSQAKKMAEELYTRTKEKKSGVCTLCVLDLLSKIYEAELQLDKAIDYTKMSLKNDKKLGRKIERYDRLANLYYQKESLTQSLSYKDSVIHAKDSLSKIVNRQLYESNKVKFQVQEYQNEIKLKAKQNEAQVRIFAIIIVLGSILFLFVYAWQKNRIIKQRQKRTIIELELENNKKEKLLFESEISEIEAKSKLRQEKLKEKIGRKNRELSAASLYHSSRNELLEEIISSLSAIPSMKKNTAIQEYIKKLKEHLKPDKMWKEFLFHFEDVNPSFLKNLKEKHPQLSQKDIRFICYLYMNLSTKEICTILNITPESFWKRKQRLSEKMELANTELYDYLFNLDKSQD